MGGEERIPSQYVIKEKHSATVEVFDQTSYINRTYMWEHFQSLNVELHRDRAAGGQSANHSDGTGTDVLKPTGLLATSRICSAHSDTNLSELPLTCGRPYANPNCTSDLI